MKYINFSFLILFTISLVTFFPALSSDTVFSQEKEKKNLYAPLISSSEKTQFMTGKKLWDQGRDLFKVQFIEQLKARHEKKELRPWFDEILKIGQQGKVDFSQKNILEDLNLEILISPETITHFWLMDAFDKALVELFDTGDEMFQKAHYLKIDLEILQTYFFNACAALKNVEFITNNIFGITSDQFDLNNFNRHFQKARYIPAQKINAYLFDYIDRIRIEKKGTLSIYDYMTFYIQTYSLIFMNQYIFIKSHLENLNNPDRKLLSRKLPGVLSKYKYHFDSNPLLKTITPQSEIIEDKTPFEEKNQPLTQEENIKILEGGPLVLDSSSLEEKTPSSANTLHSIVPIPSSEVPPSPQPSHLSSSHTSKPEIVETIDHLNDLETILNKHSDGAFKGMKTRHFLSLATALNTLGCFSEFQANNKEVKIKMDSTDQTPGIVSVMHTNHSNKAKDSGITGPTARKMNEIIELLKKQLEIIPSTPKEKTKKRK